MSPQDIEAFLADVEDRIANGYKVFSDDRVLRLVAIAREQQLDNAQLHARITELEALLVRARDIDVAMPSLTLST